ncbi:MAG: radical SAM/SPASM domain-containing protein [Acidobacteriota bacterium]
MLPRTVAEFRKLLYQQAKEDKIPVSGQFELTARCNLQCKMCYVCKPANDKIIMAQELTAEQWINLAKEARDAGMLSILLTGGEVFIRPDFQRIYEELINMGLRLSIYSNATLITPEIAKWLGRIPPTSMDITLYGASPETYEKVTGHSSAFARALNGIDLLVSEGINIDLRTTVIKDNEADLDGLVAIAEARDLIMRYSFWISARRGNSSQLDESIRLTSYELAQYELRADQAFKGSIEKIQQKLNIDLNKPMAVDDSNHSTDAEPDSHPFKCNAGKCECWITWDGRMIPCGIMEEPFTNPLMVGFNNAWRKLVSLCNTVPSCTECQQCSLLGNCYTCPARLMNETGKFDAPARYLCEWVGFRQKLSTL